MILHMVNKSPYQNLALQDCLAVADEDDALLLLEDGVYALQAGGPITGQLLERVNHGLKLYAVVDDLASRGLLEQIPGSVVPVDYSQFVSLTIEHSRIQSWY